MGTSNSSISAIDKNSINCTKSYFQQYSKYPTRSSYEISTKQEYYYHNLCSSLELYSDVIKDPMPIHKCYFDPKYFSHYFSNRIKKESKIIIHNYKDHHTFCEEIDDPVRLPIDLIKIIYEYVFKFDQFEMRMSVPMVLSAAHPYEPVIHCITSHISSFPYKNANNDTILEGFNHKESYNCNNKIEYKANKIIIKPGEILIIPHLHNSLSDWYHGGYYSDKTLDYSSLTALRFSFRFKHHFFNFDTINPPANNKNYPHIKSSFCPKKGEFWFERKTNWYEDNPLGIDAWHELTCKIENVTLSLGRTHIRSLTDDEIKSMFDTNDNDPLLKHLVGIDQVELNFDTLFDTNIFRITSQQKIT